MKRSTIIITSILFFAGIVLQLYTVNTVHQIAQHSHSNIAYYESQIETQQKLIAALEDPNQRTGSLPGIYRRELQHKERPEDSQFLAKNTLSFLMKLSYAMIIIAALLLLVKRDKGASNAERTFGLESFTSRSQQVILVISFMGFSWLMMQVVHELGHIVFTILPGGQVEKVVLHPLTFSRTDISSNPQPLLQVWGGPIVGIALPIVIWGIASLFRTSYLSFFRFFAGFCCIANGAYIGFAPDSPGLDTQVMLSLGSERWLLVIFGVTMIALGLWFFNSTGRIFGFGVPDGRVNVRHTVVSVCLLSVVVVLELIFSAA